MKRPLAGSRFGFTGVLAATLIACSGGSARPSASTLFAPPLDIEKYREQEYERLAAVERAIAECMRSAGFVYHEYDVREVVTISSQRVAGDPIAYAAAHGYGITVAPPAVSDYADPNAAELRSLSPAGQEAWQRALNGGSDGGGCRDAALASHSSVDLDQAAIQKHFAAELDDLAQRVFADQRIVDGERSWVDCMAASGYHYASFSAAPADIREELQKVGGDMSSPAYRELQRRELATATADAACPFNNFGGWELGYEVVYADYESRFAEEHASEIAEVLAEVDRGSMPSTGSEGD